MANSLGIQFFLTSAIENINIEKAFVSLANEIKNKAPTNSVKENITK